MIDGVAADPILGQLIANYPSDRTRRLIYAWSTIGVIAVVLNFTVAQIPEWWGPAITVALMAIIALGLGWYVLHVWNREIILYERGFSYVEGSKTVFFLYDEVSSIRLRAERLAYFGGLIRRDLYRFTVTTREDEHFTITNVYKRADELGTRLTDRINQTLGPNIARKLASGEKIPFSDTLIVSKDGLFEDNRTLAWADYGGYRLGNHQLALLDKNSAVWLALPLPEIDNVTLLLELLRSHQPVQKSAESSP